MCTIKETINRVKRKPTEWKWIFANHASHEKLLFKIYMELVQFDSKKITQFLKIG